MAFCEVSLCAPRCGLSWLSTLHCTSRPSCSYDLKQRYGPSVPRDYRIHKPGSTKPMKKRMKQGKHHGSFVEALGGRLHHESDQDCQHPFFSPLGVGAVSLRQAGGEAGGKLDNVSSPTHTTSTRPSSQSLENDPLSTRRGPHLHTPSTLDMEERLHLNMPRPPSQYDRRPRKNDLVTAAYKHVFHGWTIENVMTAAEHKEGLGLITTWSLDTWRQRLLTKMDLMHMHAISHSVFFLSTLVIEGLNFASIMQTDRFWTPPNWHMLYPLAICLVVSQVSGIWLAHRYRQPGPVRDNFISIAIQNLVTFWCCLAGTEAYPEVLRTVPILKVSISSACCFLILKDLVVQVTERDKIMQSYQNPKDTQAAALWTQYLILIFPYFIMLLVPKFLLDGSTEWAHSYNALHPGYYEYVFHTVLWVVGTNNIGAFAITLRDKHLVSRRMVFIILYLLSLLYMSLSVWSLIHFSDWVPELSFSLFHLPAA